MSIAVNLSPTLVDQLQIQAALLGITLNELAEKLIYQGLSKRSWQDPVSLPELIADNSSQNLTANNITESHTEMTCRDFLLSVSGTFSSGTSDTSVNVKSIVTDMLLQKYGASKHDSSNQGNISSTKI